MKLTASEIKSAKATNKPIKLAEGRGLYVHVKLNGAKYWRLKYRFAGKEKLLALGVFPAVSLAQARLLCTEAKALLSGRA